MARERLSPDKAEFQKVINDLEAAQTFSCLSELWDAVAETEWARTRHCRPLTNQVAAIRAKELGLTWKTVAGRKEDRHVPRGPVVIAPAAVQQVIAMMPEKPTESVVAKIAKGSLRMAIKLKCLDCSNFQKKEVKNCPVTSCPLWAVRPFQDKPDEIINQPA